jgi:hypothetical protein
MTGLGVSRRTQGVAWTFSALSKEVMYTDFPSHATSRGRPAPIEGKRRHHFLFTSLLGR